MLQLDPMDFDPPSDSNKTGESSKDKQEDDNSAPLSKLIQSVREKKHE